MNQQEIFTYIQKQYPMEVQAESDMIGNYSEM